VSWLDRLAAKSIPPTRLGCVAYYSLVVVLCGLNGWFQLVGPLMMMVILTALVLFGWPVLGILYKRWRRRDRYT
jgi:hypothetical protein